MDYLLHLIFEKENQSEGINKFFVRNDIITFSIIN